MHRSSLPALDRMVVEPNFLHMELYSVYNLFCIRRLHYIGLCGLHYKGLLRDWLLLLTAQLRTYTLCTWSCIPKSWTEFEHTSYIGLHNNNITLDSGAVCPYKSVPTGAMRAVRRSGNLESGGGLKQKTTGRTRGKVKSGGGKVQ